MRAAVAISVTASGEDMSNGQQCGSEGKRERSEERGVRRSDDRVWREGREGNTVAVSFAVLNQPLVII